MGQPTTARALGGNDGLGNGAYAVLALGLPRQPLLVVDEADEDGQALADHCLGEARIAHTLPTVQGLPRRTRTIGEILAIGAPCPPFPRPHTHPPRARRGQR